MKIVAYQKKPALYKGMNIEKGLFFIFVKLIPILSIYQMILLKLKCVLNRFEP